LKGAVAGTAAPALLEVLEVLGVRQQVETKTFMAALPLGPGNTNFSSANSGPPRAASAEDLDQRGTGIRVVADLVEHHGPVAMVTPPAKLVFFMAATIASASVDAARSSTSPITCTAS
jgi:hypothetical protein